LSRIILCVLIVFFNLFISADVTCAFTFTINPSRLELDVPAGGSKAVILYADNTKSDTQLHVRVFLEDIAHLPDGTNDYLALGSTPWSFSDWVTAKPVEFELPAGRFQGVRFSVSVPPDARGGRYGVVFFEGAPPMVDKAGVSAVLRLGTLVSINVTGTAIYKARLTEISTLESEEGMEILVKLHNQGNVLFRPSGQVTIKNNKEKQIAKLDLNPLRGGVLPGASRTFKVIYAKPLEEGRYIIEAVVDYGGDVLIGGKKEVSL
jgi:hypothetical protein